VLRPLIFNLIDNYQLTHNRTENHTTLILVTGARKLVASTTTMFWMAVDCCHRLKPRLEKDYFRITMQSILTNATITSFSGFAMVQFGLEAIGPSTQFNVGIWY
jgi:hypothetical protein